jgi:hypothetical protein
MLIKPGAIVESDGATRVAVSRALCGMKQAVKLFFALSRSEVGTLIAGAVICCTTSRCLSGQA